MKRSRSAQNAKARSRRFIQQSELSLRVQVSIRLIQAIQVAKVIKAMPVNLARLVIPERTKVRVQRRALEKVPVRSQIN